MTPASAIPEYRSSILALNRAFSDGQSKATMVPATRTTGRSSTDALMVLLAIVAVALVFDALAIIFGQDSRSLADDERARSWSSGAVSGRES